MEAATSLLPGLVLVFLARSLGDEGNVTVSPPLFGCVSLQNAHYNYMKYPGDSVTLYCSKSCREDAPPIWYHSFVRTPRKSPEPLGWKGASHEAALTAIPTRWGVGYFCCGCEEDSNPRTDSCCWGVAYHPSVNFTLTPSWERGQTTLAPTSSHLLLRCEVRGFPRVDIEVIVPPGFNGSKKARCSTDKSWYSTIYSCQFTSAEEDSGKFVCRGTITVDSQNGEDVKHAKITALDILVYRQPTIIHVYQASELQGPQLDIVCVVNCDQALACSVSWLFNDSLLSRFGTSYQHTANESVHTLSIAQPGETEVGRYTCVLSSSGGRVEDSKTIIMELPDGVYPSPLGEMPGPVEPVVLDSVNHGPIIALVITVGSSLVVVALGVLFIAIVVFRKKQLSRRDEHEEREMAVISPAEVPSGCGEEVETDSGVIRSRRSLRT